MSIFSFPLMLNLVDEKMLLHFSLSEFIKGNAIVWAKKPNSFKNQLLGKKYPSFFI